MDCFFAIDREKWYHLRRIAIAYRHHPATICSEGGKKVNDVENIKMVWTIPCQVFNDDLKICMVAYMISTCAEWKLMYTVIIDWLFKSKINDPY